MPPASPGRPSSGGEHSIPFDHSPRILRRAISMPFGIVVPTVASGTRSPSAMLNAPQQICSGSPSPASTSTSWMRSASGCARESQHTRDDDAVEPLADARSCPRPACRARRARRAMSSGVARRSARTRAARRAGPSSELLEEADVVGEQVAQVVDAVALLREAVDAEAEREALTTPRDRCRSASARSGAPCRSRRAPCRSRRDA